MAPRETDRNQAKTSELCKVAAAPEVQEEARDCAQRFRMNVDADLFFTLQGHHRKAEIYG